MQGFTYRFYKTLQDRWYIDIKDYKGPKEDLELVLGADTMLNIMAGNNDNIWIFMSEEFFEKSSQLIFKGMNDDIGSGADYIFQSFQGIELNYKVWLCDVTKFIFDKFPKTIYISLIE